MLVPLAFGSARATHAAGSLQQHNPVGAVRSAVFTRAGAHPLGLHACLPGRGRGLVGATRPSAGDGASRCLARQRPWVPGCVNALRTPRATATPTTPTRPRSPVPHRGWAGHGTLWVQVALVGRCEAPLVVDRLVGRGPEIEIDP